MSLFVRSSEELLKFRIRGDFHRIPADMENWTHVVTPSSILGPTYEINIEQNIPADSTLVFEVKMPFACLPEEWETMQQLGLDYFDGDTQPL